MTVRSLGEDEVALYKSLRLRALSSDPAGFGSSHARESAFDDDTWRLRLSGFAGRPGVVLIDVADDEPAGMVGVGEAERVGEAVVWGMWVEPCHRRSGVGRRLLAAAIDWARNRSCTAVVLAVRDGNNAAGSLYRSAGFQECGRRSDDETVLRLDLADPLWADTAGNGPAILFLHSAVCDARMWEPQWRHYRRDYTVARVDLQGFGRTGLGPGPVRHADDVLSAMDRLGLDSATVVGSSLGGRVALELAVVAPARVDALLLAAPPLYDHDWSPTVREFGRAEDEALEAGDLDRAVELNVELWLDGPHRDRADVDDETRALVIDMQRRSFGHLLPHLDDADEEAAVPDLRDRLGSIGVPTMVVVGEHDVKDFHDIAGTLVDRLPGALLAVVAGTAHLPSIEKPQNFNNVLDELLARAGSPLDGIVRNR